MADKIKVPIGLHDDGSTKSVADIIKEAINYYRQAGVEVGSLGDKLKTNSREIAESVLKEAQLAVKTKEATAAAESQLRINQLLNAEIEKRNALEAKQNKTVAKVISTPTTGANADLKERKQLIAEINKLSTVAGSPLSKPQARGLYSVSGENLKKVQEDLQDVTTTGKKAADVLQRVNDLATLGLSKNKRYASEVDPRELGDARAREISRTRQRTAASSARPPAKPVSASSIEPADITPITTVTVPPALAKKQAKEKREATERVARVRETPQERAQRAFDTRQEKARLEREAGIVPRESKASKEEVSTSERTRQQLEKQLEASRLRAETASTPLGREVAEQKIQERRAVRSAKRAREDEIAEDRQRVWKDREQREQERERAQPRFVLPSISEDELKARQERKAKQTAKPMTEEDYADLAKSLKKERFPPDVIDRLLTQTRNEEAAKFPGVVPEEGARASSQRVHRSAKRAREDDMYEERQRAWKEREQKEIEKTRAQPRYVLPPISAEETHKVETRRAATQKAAKAMTAADYAELTKTLTKEHYPPDVIERILAQTRGEEAAKTTRLPSQFKAVPASQRFNALEDFRSMAYLSQRGGIQSEFLGKTSIEGGATIGALTANRRAAAQFTKSRTSQDIITAAAVPPLIDSATASSLREVTKTGVTTMFAIMNKAGESVASMLVRNKGKSLEIINIQAELGPDAQPGDVKKNTLGHTQMARTLRDLRTHYPDAEELTGVRVSGSRHARDIEFEVPTAESDTTVRLPKKKIQEESDAVKASKVEAAATQAAVNEFRAKESDISTLRAVRLADLDSVKKIAIIDEKQATEAAANLKAYTAVTQTKYKFQKQAADAAAKEAIAIAAAGAGGTGAGGTGGTGGGGGWGRNGNRPPKGPIEPPGPPLSNRQKFMDWLQEPISTKSINRTGAAGVNDPERTLRNAASITNLRRTGLLAGNIGEAGSAIGAMGFALSGGVALAGITGIAFVARGILDKIAEARKAAEDALKAVEEQANQGLVGSIKQREDSLDKYLMKAAEIRQKMLAGDNAKKSVEALYYGEKPEETPEEKEAKKNRSEDLFSTAWRALPKLGRAIGTGVMNMFSTILGQGIDVGVPKGEQENPFTGERSIYVQETGSRQQRLVLVNPSVPFPNDPVRQAAAIELQQRQIAEMSITKTEGLKSKELEMFRRRQQTLDSETRSAPPRTAEEFRKYQIRQQVLDTEAKAAGLSHEAIAGVNPYVLMKAKERQDSYDAMDESRKGRFEKAKWQSSLAKDLKGQFVSVGDALTSDNPFVAVLTQATTRVDEFRKNFGFMTEDVKKKYTSMSNELKRTELFKINLTQALSNVSVVSKLDELQNNPNVYNANAKAKQKDTLEFGIRQSQLISEADKLRGKSTTEAQDLKRQYQEILQTPGLTGVDMSRAIEQITQGKPIELLQEANLVHARAGALYDIARGERSERAFKRESPEVLYAQRVLSATGEMVKDIDQSDVSKLTPEQRAKLRAVNAAQVQALSGIDPSKLTPQLLESTVKAYQQQIALQAQQFEDAQKVADARITLDKQLEVAITNLPQALKGISIVELRDRAGSGVFDVDFAGNVASLHNINQGVSGTPAASKSTMDKIASQGWTR